MSIIHVNYQDSFDLWRQKANLLSQNVGDMDDVDSDIIQLVTDHGFSEVNLVNITNSMHLSTKDNLRRLAIKLIGMS